MRRMLLALTIAGCTWLTACETEDMTAPSIAPDAALLPANGDGTEIKVMTRNVYLGFDIDQVLAGNMPLDAGLQALLATKFQERAFALAAEIAATNPDLIGLQEVINYRIQDPGDFLQTGVPNATTPMIPFLYILQIALSAYGLDYEVAVENPTTDVEVPLPTGPTTYVDIRYTDSDVILARSDVAIGKVTTQLYQDMLTFNLGGIPGSRPLGFVAVEAVVAGRPFVFASTHLETQNYPDIQIGQTKELINWTKHQKLPVVVVGDFNSAANADAPGASYTRTYNRLLIPGTFQDLWAIAHPGEPGLTCCYEPNLIEAEPGFNQRLDLILIDKVGARLMSDVQATIVGVDPFQVSQPRWASDHAGVVASFHLQNAKK